MLATTAVSLRPTGRSVRQFLYELAILAPFLLHVALARVSLPTDPDYWWHVKAGEYIVQSGSIPTVDPFTFTSLGKPWVAHEWLTEVGFYGMLGWWGYAGTVVVFALVSLLTWLIVYVLCRQNGLGDAAAVIFSTIGFIIASPCINVRPQMLTLLLAAVFTLILHSYRSGSYRLLLFLPLALVLWVNLHGGFVVGIALIALRLAGDVVDSLMARRPAIPRPLVATLVVALAATLVNPHGPGIWAYSFSYFEAGNPSQAYIQEWQPPDLRNPQCWAFGAALVSSLAVGLARQPIRGYQVIGSLGFAFLALQSTRHLPFFGVFAIPVLGAAWVAVVPALRTRLAESDIRRLLLPVAAALTVVILVADLGPSREVTLGWQPGNKTYPAGAVAALQASTEGGRLLNEYDWGGFLIYGLYPTWMVYIDGRMDVHGARPAQDLLTALNAQPGWERIIKDNEIAAVVVRPERPLGKVLAMHPDWFEIPLAGSERLFVRR